MNRSSKVTAKRTLCWVALAAVPAFAALATRATSLDVSTRLVPGNDILFGAVAPCDTANWDDFCRIDLPNGDFAGPPGDSYMHKPFEWIGTGRWHSTGEHIEPWAYRSPDDTGWVRRRAGTTFHLEKPGDAITRWVTLPPLLDPMRNAVARPVEYAVRARFGGVASGASVRLALTAGHNGQPLTEWSVLETSRSTQLDGRVEVSIPFKPEWAGAQLGIAIAYEQGTAPVRIDDVVVLRHTGDGVPGAPMD